MENIVESYIDEYKDLKRTKKGVTIEEFVNKHFDVAEELAPRLYFDKFEGWLNTTIQRRTIDWIRKNKKKPVIISIDDTTEDDSPDDSALYLLDQAIIKIRRGPLDDPLTPLLAKEILRAFERLPELQRKICLFYYVDGYNDREIGEMLDMITNTVTGYRNRGIKKVREILRRWEYHE